MVSRLIKEEIVMQLSQQLINGLMIAIMLTVIAGCSNHKSATESDFGKSVRSMVRAQTLDPQEALLPDPEALDHGNGERLNNVMEAYKSNVSTPPDTKQLDL
jgi:hypothetical protein